MNHEVGGSHSVVAPVHWTKPYGFPSHEKILPQKIIKIARANNIVLPSDATHGALYRINIYLVYSDNLYFW